MMASNPARLAMQLRDLTIRDPGGECIVSDIRLDLRRGEILVLIGETGSGKSLIAQALFGLLPRGFTASGTLAFASGTRLDLARPGLLRLHWAREMLLLPQEPRAALDPTMPVGRQLAGAVAPDGLSPRAALAAVDVPQAMAAHLPHALSGGMAQRVLVAAALTSDAPFIVADEPTKGLDAHRIGQAGDALLALSAKGRALLVITHDLGLARLLTAGGHGASGQIAVLRAGRMVECGAGEAILNAPAHPYTRAWMEADPAGWPRCACGCGEAPTVLAAKGLGFARPAGPPLFRDLDLALREGDILAVTGPSGCGKSSLGNVLLGLLPPLRGRVDWRGIDPYADPRGRARLRRRYQKLHQDPATAFLPNRVLRRQFADLETLMPGGGLAGALPPLLDSLGLSPRLLDRYPSEISGGEAQRLALARVLLLRPEVIVADEPTSRLDPIIQKQIMDLLRGVAETQRIGMIIIGHDRRMLSALAGSLLDLGNHAG